MIPICSGGCGTLAPCADGSCEDGCGTFVSCADGCGTFVACTDGCGKFVSCIDGCGTTHFTSHCGEVCGEVCGDFNSWNVIISCSKDGFCLKCRRPELLDRILVSKPLCTGTMEGPDGITEFWSIFDLSLDFVIASFFDGFEK